jgi:hypothetical protein
MQTLVVALLVAGAALYVARRIIASLAKARREKDQAGCGSDGCCKH